jgi:actin-related protein
LLADLDSFSTRDEQEQKEREEQLRKEKEALAQRAREAEERRLKEEAERKEKEEKKRLKEEERARKAKDEEELREREEKEKERLKEEEEKRKKEAEEREKKAKQEERLAASSQRGAQFDAEARAKREAALQARPVRAKGERAAAKGGWGKPIAITLFLLLVIVVGVAHVMPIDTSDYERGAAEALGQPVKIGSATLSLIGGLQLKFHNVSIGDTKIAELRGFPELDALLGPMKVFSRIEVDGARVPQEALGPALFTKIKAQNFSVARVVAKNLELTGPLVMPKGLELDALYNPDGTVRTAFLRGPETLVVKLEPKGQVIEADMSASTISLPFAPEVSFGRFSAKGTISSRGFAISEWDAAALNGTLSGTANITWGDTWVVEGVVTARNINAAVFAPALISDGRAEGSGRFSMRGSQPAKLGETARIDGTFTISRGMLGSFDLARAVQSQGKASSGRTQFAELTGNGVYDRGAVALRNVTLGAGQLNAGASADIAQNGALSGRIVADVRIASQQLRAVLNLGGTVREPQVRN